MLLNAAAVYNSIPKVPPLSEPWSLRRWSLT